MGIPKKQINGSKTPTPAIRYLDLIINKLHIDQDKGYNYVVQKHKED